MAWSQLRPAFGDPDAKPTRHCSRNPKISNNVQAIDAPIDNIGNAHQMPYPVPSKIESSDYLEMHSHVKYSGTVMLSKLSSRKASSVGSLGYSVKEK
jgi:hypothetical protein